MDPAAELALLETAYGNYITNGIAEYRTEGGRSVRRVNVEWMTTRMDQLRAIVYRQNNGICTVAQNRQPE